MTDAKAGDEGGSSGDGERLDDAASVVLLRDPRHQGRAGFEVLMVERHVESEFAGGAYVFPGGKVDDLDRDLDDARWSGLDLETASERMRVERDLALGLHVAAVRETFEEAGILLARRRGEMLTSADLERDSFTEARSRLSSRDERWDWREWLADEDLVLDLGALGWWSWWVTPQGMPRRYDTRFFVARAPDEQVDVYDQIEITDARWITPGEALEAARENRVRVVYPTRKNLEALIGHTSGDEVLEAARSGRADTRRIEPEIVRKEEGEVWLRHPYQEGLEQLLEAP